MMVATKSTTKICDDEEQGSGQNVRMTKVEEVTRPEQKKSE